MITLLTIFIVITLAICGYFFGNKLFCEAIGLFNKVLSTILGMILIIITLAFLVLLFYGIYKGIESIF